MSSFESYACQLQSQLEGMTSKALSPGQQAPNNHEDPQGLEAEI